MNGAEADLEPGDLVIYRGCDLEHWREPFTIEDENAWHVQGFFHYVDKNGPFKDYKFDKRESLGMIDKSERPNNIPAKSYIKYV